MFEKTKNKQNRGRGWLISKKSFITLTPGLVFSPESCRDDRGRRLRADEGELLVVQVWMLEEVKALIGVDEATQVNDQDDGPEEQP